MPYRVERNQFGRYMIVREDAPWLAWSGSQWARHDRGLGLGGTYISNFSSEREARDEFARVPGERLAIPVVRVKRGDFVTMWHRNDSINAMVLVAQGDSASAVVAFDGVFCGYVRIMPLMYHDGAYHDLQETRPFTMEERVP